MIEKRLLFGRYCMRWIAFSALIVLIFLSLTTPVFAQVVDTYESDYSNTKDSYTLGETVYAKATGLTSENYYDFYYNYVGPAYKEYGSDLNRPDTTGQWRSSYLLISTDPTTTSWEVRVVNQGADNKLKNQVCVAGFTAIEAPEFPSIFALGAGIMFLICGAIYFGMRKHAMRKV